MARNDPEYKIGIYCKECDRRLTEVTIGKDCEIRVPVCKSCRHPDYEKSYNFSGCR